MPALSMNEKVTMFFALMPHNRAASRFAAQARIRIPSRVYRKKPARIATTTALMPTTQSTCGEIYTPPSRIEVTEVPVK
jgi:hypothetical protein